jgi:hypothetical protein
MALAVRAIRVDEIPRLQQFVARHWKADHVFVHSAELLLWQHFENPFRPRAGYGPEELSFLGAWDGEALVAVLGEIPVGFALRERSVPGTWLALWKNCDEQRHPTAGIRLLQHVTAGEAAFVGGIGMNPRVHRAYRLFRFRVLPDLPLFVLRNPDVTSALVQPKRATHDPERAARLDARADAGGAAYEEGPPTPAAWDAFWARMRRGLAGTDRSFAYMDWRYLRHPVYRYEWLRVPAADGGLAAAAVVRAEPVGGERVLQVVELLGEGDAARRLAGALAERMRELGASFLAFRCGQTARFDAFREVGGGLYGADDGDYEIPSLFQPVVPAYRPLAWGYRSVGAARDLAPGDCYVTRSDGDQDRPSHLPA